MILDSLFIGAFGKWWRGGTLEAWYRDVVHRSKDEEGWSSGILGFKALDKFSDYNGVCFFFFFLFLPSCDSSFWGLFY